MYSFKVILLVATVSTVATLDFGGAVVRQHQFNIEDLYAQVRERQLLAETEFLTRCAMGTRTREAMLGAGNRRETESFNGQTMITRIVPGATAPLAEVVVPVTGMSNEVISDILNRYPVRRVGNELIFTRVILRERSRRSVNNNAKSKLHRTRAC